MDNTETHITLGTKYRDTHNTGHKIQNKDKQDKKYTTHKTKKMNNTDTTKKSRG
jgi:hypothetical protein